MIDTHASLIYIADDEPVNVLLLESILREAGFARLRSFADGATLLRAVEDEEPDLILLDLRMPVLDGLAVLKTLRAPAKPVTYLPVLVLTADATKGSRTNALANGANDFLTKPFDIAEVVLRTRNLLETRLLHKALKDRNVTLRGQVAAASQALAEREHEWAAQAVALGRLEPQATAEATAQRICDELSGLPGLTRAMIVALDAAGDAVPLARHASIDVRFGVNRAMPKAIADRWRERLVSGTWIGPWEDPFGSGFQRVIGDDPTAMAVVPLRSGQSPLGALVVSTTAREGVPYLAGRTSLLESFAAVTAALLGEDILSRQKFGAVRARTEQILASAAFRPVFQPIVDLSSGVPIAYEALTRFEDGTRPDRVFADAAAIGLGLDLEAATLRAAVIAAQDFAPGIWLSLNVSPDLLLEGHRLRDALSRASRPVVLEVTEHVAIEDYAAVLRAVSSAGRDVRCAVDDAGAGFASFRHILELRPDFVKLDIGLVRDVDRDDVRQALVAGIVYFARKSKCQLIAEGIETVGEREQLRALGVGLGQGYLLGRPEPAAHPTRVTDYQRSPARRSAAPADAVGY